MYSLKSVKDLESNIIYMTIVKLFLLKSNCEEMHIYNNDNYINFNENSRNVYYNTMKLATYKFYLKNKIVEKIFVKYIVINNFGEILYFQEYIQPNIYFYLLRLT